MKKNNPIDPDRIGLENRRLVSFDGGVRESVDYQRPDRYRAITTSLGKRFRIARGGGYSYAAASFGKNVIVQDVTLFDRILAFDRERSRIKVEAGITLSSLLKVILPCGLWLPVLPGYPGITVGGCVAANVHGKNPAIKGAFRNYVEELTLFHPAYGIVSVSEDSNPAVFNLTCGGYGLTGVILSVTLRLEKLRGSSSVIKRTAVASLSEAYQVLNELSGVSEFAYSMHQSIPAAGQFGRGYVSSGSMIPDGTQPDFTVPPYKVIRPSNRGTVPFSVWGGSRTKSILGVHWLAEAVKKPERTETLFDSLFPLARAGYYFFLYGKQGLAEYQLIIPSGEVDPFLAEFRRVMLKEKPPGIMCSLKLFKGTPGLLRFEMDGACLAVDFVRNSRTLRFLATLDSMLVSSGGIPYLIKDSRLPDMVVKRCYPGFPEMRKQLHAYDPDRLYRSEMSERLGL